jgi:hypothetical protein
MDVTGKFVLIKKHTMRKHKRARRHYAESCEELNRMRELGAEYAVKQGEDFLIVQIVEEISKPEPEGETPA